MTTKLDETKYNQKKLLDIKYKTNLNATEYITAKTLGLEYDEARTLGNYTFYNDTNEHGILKITNVAQENSLIQLENIVVEDQAKSLSDLTRATFGLVVNSTSNKKSLLFDSYFS